MFHILPGSNPAVAPSVISEDTFEGSLNLDDREGSQKGGSHKKRNRRRRRGKTSRTAPSPSTPSKQEQQRRFTLTSSFSSRIAYGRNTNPTTSSATTSSLDCTASSTTGGATMMTPSTPSHHDNSCNPSPGAYIHTSSPASVISSSSTATSKKQHDAPMTKRDLYFALDCEMVGVGQDGLSSAVGRVTIVNWENQVVLDTYVQVPVPVTDYRTYVSGITAEDLMPGGAPDCNVKNQMLLSFTQVRELVQVILRGKILIGHGLECDLAALSLSHPWCDIRDTATYSYFMRDILDPVTQQLKLVPRKLRDLTWDVLRRQIQVPGKPHSPIEDAVAALDLYKASREHWEDYLIKMSQKQEMEQANQQHQQVLENHRRQQQQQQQQQQLAIIQQQQLQHQQQQLRRWQWFAASSAAQQRSAIYGYPQQHSQYQQHQGSMPRMQPPTSAYPRYGNAPTLSSIHSQAASAYLTGEASPRSSSSWFGFGRRQPKPPPNQLAPAPSYESTSTHTTVLDNSFSQDPSMSLSMSRSQSMASSYGHQHHDMLCHYSRRSTTGIGSPDNYSFQEMPEEPLSFDAEQANEDPSLGVSPSRDLNSSPQPEVVSTTSASSTSPAESPRSSLSPPTEYKPPMYFTNPDPDPMSSSSWFKIWSRSNNTASNGKLSELAAPEQVTAEDESLDNSKKEKPKRKSESSSITSDSPSYSLFGLLTRRKSESNMENMTVKGGDEEVPSRSMH